MQDSSTGLRERQRTETLHRLHDAAVELVREDGMTAATVSAIADRAGVSRRTFFNYYATKEDAVLGAGPAHVPDGAIDGLLDGDDRLGDAVRLVIRVVRTIRHTPTDRVALRKLRSANPELRERTQQHTIHAYQLLADALAERYEGAQADSAIALILIAVSAVRFAYRHDPDIFDNPDSPAVSSAVTTFREIIKDLQ
ncbi:TetR/AcrR family transcriptional regulator [Gordonia zhaorongruii]|uniref:TetR/AcrR family transcriptional regulator n=1 Tax=Gordonia zhaorongruii TaxID=2597659 RepID=UPI001053475E|nr:TetR/AcrR family transcriptional regulator [Gordonia zhaorongruii]